MLYYYKHFLVHCIQDTLLLLQITLIIKGNKSKFIVHFLSFLEELSGLYYYIYIICGNTDTLKSGVIQVIISACLICYDMHRENSNFNLYK